MIKRNYLILIMALLAFVSSYAQAYHDRTLSLIPYPVSITEGEGEFVFNDKTVIALEDAELKAVAEDFAQTLTEMKNAG